MLRKISKNKLLLSFVLSIVLGSIIIVPNIIIGRGIYSLCADFNLQQIPFNILMNNSIKNGSFLWTWFNDLGSNFIGTFSFYNLFSPFNIIGYLFPSKCFPYLIGLIFILKYGICGICSYLFLQRYVKNKNYAVLGSLLYTFSGFQLTNILFYHFHDVVVFFPLFLYSLDRFIYDKKRGRLALVILLCTLTNWFFFIGEGVFTFLYFIVKVICKDYKINKKLFFNLLFEVVIGVLMALVVLLPTMLFIMDNPRIGSSWTFISMFKYQFSNYFEIIRGMILPPEAMANRAMLTEFNYKSVELYLPIVGMILVIPYLLKNKKNCFSILFIISLVFMFIPILNSSFFLFNTTYYARWFYMPILIMSLMSIKTLEDKLSIKSGLIYTGGCVLLLILFIIIYNKIYSFNIYNQWYLIIIITEMLFGIGVLLICKDYKNNILLLIIFVFIYVSFQGNYMTYKYKYNNIKYDKDYIEYISYNSEFNKYNNYRFNSSKSCNSNIGYIENINNIKTFNSNINGSSFKFYNSIGVERITNTDIEINNKNLNDILGVKYIISCEGDITDNRYNYVEDIDSYKIYENKDYLEFGYTVSDYIKEDDYNKLSNEERINILKEKVVLSDKDLDKYKDIYPNDVKYNSNKFEFINNGFKSIIDSSDNTLAIFQIPYDRGFSVKVNGKKSNIIKVNNGFIGVKINKGVNKIEVKYMPKGLKDGLIISILSIFVYLGYLFKIGVYKR